MGDDIEINVTETTNIIEITPQPNDQIVDIAVTDNAPNVEINVTPSVIEINVTRGSSTAIWGTITGNINDQTDLATKFGLKADLVDGKVPSSQLPSYVDDVIEVANYAALPTTGESGKIYVTIDNNHIFRWTGSTYVEITDNTAVWGAITGTLSSQTDLQSALNSKFNNPIGNTTQYIAGDGSLITFPTILDAGNLICLVRNQSGSTINAGSLVYISGGSGNKPLITLSQANNEANSSRTFGMVRNNIGNNSNGYVVITGQVTDLDTSAYTEGTVLYLSTSVAGGYTNIKPSAPNHMVYVGEVVYSHGVHGTIQARIQNGYELDEIHNVSISSITNKDLLTYESATSLWKNKSLSTILGYTPADDSNVVHLTGAETITGTKSFNSTTGIGIRSNNSGSGYGIYSDNSSTGVAYYVANSGQGNGFSVANALSSLGNLFDGSYNGTQNFVVNYLGELTASKLIKSGGTSSQFLKADGSVDSSTYALTSQLHNAVTIGTANGLSLSTQVLSLGLASSSTNGALSSTDWNIFNSKQVAMSFNSPLSYSLGTLSINQATTSSNGYLSSTDWNIFNGKQNALTNPITGTGTTNYLSKFTGASSLGNSLIYDNGTNVGIGTTAPSDGKLQVAGSSQLGNTIAQTYLGVGAAATKVTSNGSYAIGVDAADGSNERMRITSGGNVLIGTITSYSGKLNVAGGMYSIDNVVGSYSTSSSTSYGFFNSGSGTFILTNSGVANVGSFSMATGIYTPLSDINKKKDFEESTIGLKEILSLKPTLYRMKSDNTNGKKELGFIAQEVKEFIPQAYVENNDFIGLNFNAIVAALVKSIQELKAEIEILKTK